MQREYPAAPISGVGAIVLNKNNAGEVCVLVVRRGREPLRGEWSLPGGVLELGETLRDGVRREVKEEAGLDIEVLEHVETFDRIARDEAGRVRYHYVISDWLCLVVDGELRCGDDADEAAWLTREEFAANIKCPLDALARRVIEKAWAMYVEKYEAK
jgi:ADP-ribose pyrophosphatase YjhB (NUDIX family)